MSLRVDHLKDREERWRRMVAKLINREPPDLRNATDDQLAFYYYGRACECGSIRRRLEVLENVRRRAAE